MDIPYLCFIFDNKKEITILIHNIKTNNGQSQNTEKILF